MATENNPAMIMELDLKNNIQYISPQWKEIMRSSAPPIGTPISRIIASNNETDLTIFDVALKRMLQQGSVSYTITFNAFCCGQSYRQVSPSQSPSRSNSNADNSGIDSEVPKGWGDDDDDDMSTNIGKGPTIGIGLTIPSTQEFVSEHQNGTVSDVNGSYSLDSSDTSIPSPLSNSIIRREQETHHDANNGIVSKRGKITEPEVETGTGTGTEREVEVITLEACGVLITNTNTLNAPVPTHTMWVLKPYNPGWHSSLSDTYFLPEGFIKRLGFGATIFSDYLKLLDDEKIIDEYRVPLPRRELCRICESFVPAWWLETHSQSCIIQHRIESLIQLVHDSLVEQRALIQQYLEGDVIKEDQNGMAESQCAYKGMKLCDSSKPQMYSYAIDVLESLVELCDHVIAINTSDLKCVDHDGNECFKPGMENGDEAARSSDNTTSTTAAAATATTSSTSLTPLDVAPRDTPPSLSGYFQGQPTLISTPSKPHDIPPQNYVGSLSPPQSPYFTDYNSVPALCDAVYELSPKTKENILKARAWKIKGTDITFDMEDHDPDTGLQMLVHDTLELSRKKISAVIRLDNSMLYASNIRKEVNGYVLQLIKDQLERNRLSRAQDGLLSNNSSRISLLTSPMLHPRLEASILFNGHVNSNEADPGDGLINDYRTVDDDEDNSSCNTLNDRAMGQLTPFNTIARIDSPIFSDAYMHSDRVPNDGDSTRGRTRHFLTARHCPSNSNDTDVPSGGVTGSERGSSRSITPNSLLVPTTIADTRNTVGSTSAPGSVISGSSTNNSARLVGSAVSHPLKNSRPKLQASSSSSSLVPTRKNSPPLGSNTGFNSNNSSGSVVLNGNSYSSIAGTANTSRFYHEKSPMDSPYNMSRDYLTPEQLPTASLSPNQPLSPLLLATNQVKSHVPSIKDYDIIKPISKGAYGSVYLARKKLTGDYFAIKVLRKSDMIAKNQVTNVKSERAIMMVQSEKPYVAKLYATFQNKDNLFLVMEYLPGGDLATLLKMMGYLPEKWAKQYLSEIVVSVDDMHKDGIIHHDLKPENLLIDLSGHLKLTDFGLSRAGLVRRHKHPSRRPKLSISGLDSFSGGPQAGRAGSNSSNVANLTPNKPIRKSSLSRNTEIPSTLSLTADADDPSKSSVGTDDFEEEILDFKRTASQISFSLLDISRSSTPPPGSRSQSISISDNKLSTTCATSNEPLATTPNTSLGTSNVNSAGGIQSAYLRNRQNSSVASIASNTSDLALFHPDDSSGAKKFFGTPDYLAPETIEGTGKDEQCDWWSVGCILFEMILGYPPFHASSPDAVFKNILSCNIQWPVFNSPEEEKEYISPEAKDLILKLLEPVPSERLGVNGISDFKDHAFFKDIDWDHVYEEEASFVPHIDDPENTDYFDPRGAMLHDLDDDAAESPGETSLRKNCFFTGDYDNEIFDNKSTSSFLLSMGSSSHSNSGNSNTGKEASSVPVSRKHSSSSGVDLIPGVSPLHLNRPMEKLSISSVLESVAGPNDCYGTGGSIGSRSSSVTKSIPLAIPPHMRERRPSKLSESQTEFGSFSFRNLSALDKANKDTINRLKNEHIGDRPGGFHRRTSSGSIISIPPEGPLSKHRPSRHSMVGIPGVGSPIPKSVARSEVSSIRSISPDRFALDSQPIITISRKSSVASNADVSSPSSFMTTTGAFRSPSASVWNDADSFTTPTSSATKFKSPLSPVIGPSGTQFRIKNLAKNFTSGHHHSISLDLSSGDENDRLQAVARINSTRRRRSSRRSSNNSKSEIDYHMDVLLCEPIPIHRFRATRDLEKLGCTVVNATAADELVSKATSGVKFDLILTTLRLPNIVVTDIVRLIRQTNGINSKTPVIATTNYYQEAVNTHLFNDVLEKPIDIDRLRRLILKYALKKSQDTDNSVFSDTEDVAPS